MTYSPPYRSMGAMLLDRAARTPRNASLRQKEGGTWVAWSWERYLDEASRISAAMAGAGIARGDRVAIMSQTCLRWMVADWAVLLRGAVAVPIYPSMTAQEAAHILSDSGSRLLFVENEPQLRKVLSARERFPSLERCVVMHGWSGSEPGVVSYEDFRATGKAYDAGELRRDVDSVGPDELATIVYTSGTTGPPKGVMLTHANGVFECWSVSQLLDAGEQDETLMFLPLSHIFARLAHFAGVYKGYAIALAESATDAQVLLSNIADIRPTFVFSVPRLYEKIHSKILNDVASAPPLRRRIFAWARSVGERVSGLRQQRVPCLPFGLRVQFAIATKLVFSKLQARFGGRLRFFISGGAPLAKEISEFFHASGMLILEGYGLTETFAATNINRLDRYRFGTVGPALPGVDIKIAPDGEILQRGPNIFRGYFNLPEATAEALEPDGWFHSGDIGEMDADGFLRITDRKKDLIVTAAGKNIAPQNIENHLKQDQYISQAMVAGDRRPYLVALVTLDEAELAKWAANQGIAFSSFAELSRRAEVRNLLESRMSERNAALASYETVKRFAILESDFTQEAGDLTPTLKLKRKVVTEKHRALIESLYA